MPLQSTSGAASYDAFGGGAAAKVNYIEDFFQSYLRTGTGASATVTTGLDGSTKETLVWTKSRSAATNHKLTDNVRGATKALSSNTTGAEATDSQGLTAFSATGYTLGTNTDYNNSGATYVDWQWVAQPKFFDVVTYTGTGSATTIAHNLGSVPGCIIVKRTDTSSNWVVYHRSLNTTAGGLIALNLTFGELADVNAFNSTVPTSTVFTVGSASSTNGSGGTFVAYIFAHDAGGFGLTGTDNVISCGSFTTDGSSNATITLGYEPQWVLTKRTDGGGGAWGLYDTMRGWSYSAQNYLLPNDSGAEGTINSTNFKPTATGFTIGSPYDSSATYIYIAIRRGPMKVPTSGTSVFNALSRTGTAATATVSTTIQPDLVMSQARGGMYNVFYDRLRGAGATLSPNLGSDAESAVTNGITAFNNTSYTVGTDASQNRINWNTYTYANWLFRRAPSFFDEVCYTGTGSATTVTHNLAAVPELMIVKSRSSGTYDWRAYSVTIGNTNYLTPNSTGSSAASSTTWNNTTPTASVFTVGTSVVVNGSGLTYVAYLFATCAGVSKVGSYTGNGSTQTIDCGFTGGARFVLIKCTSTTGDWYVYDTARGMTTLTDPYLLLNSTAAESATLGSVTTVSTGFALNAGILAAINTNGASYIFLAIS